jgi:hypothetical protein
MNCRICNSQTTLIHKGRILNKYDISYFQCENCQFIQTESPYWLAEAYTEAIASTDVGLVGRNLLFKEMTEDILTKLFPECKSMVDYGGGYGLFVRMMRDRGFDYYRQDNFCKNLFAEYFDVKDRVIKAFDFLTAFEVFEHLSDPLKEIETMFSYAPTILFSTILIPSSLDDFKQWWYLSSMSGQHVSFYSYKSLEQIANNFSKKLYSNKINLHILTDKVIDAKMVSKYLNSNDDSVLIKLEKAFRKNTRVSLTEKDHQYDRIKGRECK